MALFFNIYFDRLSYILYINITHCYYCVRFPLDNNCCCVHQLEIYFVREWNTWNIFLLITIRKVQRFYFWRERKFCDQTLWSIAVWTFNCRWLLLFGSVVFMIAIKLNISISISKCNNHEREFLLLLLLVLVFPMSNSHSHVQ